MPYGDDLGVHLRRRHLQDGHRGEDGRDDRSRVDAVGDGIEPEDEPVRDHAARDVGDVTGQHVSRPRRRASARPAATRPRVARGLAPNSTTPSRWPRPNRCGSRVATTSPTAYWATA